MQTAEKPDLLNEIETLQDEVLFKLDELNRQIETTLEIYTKSNPPGEGLK